MSEGRGKKAPGQALKIAWAGVERGDHKAGVV